MLAGTTVFLVLDLVFVLIVLSLAQLLINVEPSLRRTGNHLQDKNMWIQRNSEELKRWNAAARKDARFQGLLMGGLIWVGASIILAGGWVASANWVAVTQRLAGGFWSRLLFVGALGLPFAAWVYRREERRQFQMAAEMTICPRCDTSGEDNAGAACQCGGEYVLQSTMRWVDDESTDKHD
jgi:hypothetical protein